MRLPAAAFTVALAAVALPAGAIHICTNENGVKTYQDEPCTTKRASPALAPVKADALNDRVVRETMKRYETAMSTQDPVSVARLVTSDLVVNLKMLNRPPIKYDYVKFTEAVKLVLNGYPTYKVSHRCKNGKPVLPASLVLECTTVEEIRMQGKYKQGTANETFHFVIEDGVVKVKQLDSVQVTALKDQ